MIKFKFFSMTVLIFSTFVSAADYFVSPLGDDTFSGSRAQPFKTLQQAASAAKPGDVCYIREGIYRQPLKPSTSGTAAAPITFVAEHNEKVVISTCDTASSWSMYSENVYVMEVDKEVSQLFIDGELAHQARFPNNTSANPFEFESIPLTLTENSVSSPALDQPQNHWEGGIVWAIVGERWISQIAHIESSTPGNLSITDNSWTENTGDGIGYITATLSALDTAGEWHYENDTLYLQVAPGDTPDNHTVELKTREWVIDLSGRDHIVVKDIETIGGAVNMNRSDHCTLDGMKMQWLSHFVDIQTASTSWTRHDWTNINYEGIGVGIFGTHNTLKNSEISWSAGDGVTLYGENNRIENCIIHDCNYSGLDCNPITATGPGHVITRNTVYNGGRGLIDFLFTKQITITYNEVYNASLVNRDVGGIYTWGSDAEGSVIAYNWVHDIVSVGGYELGIGIYVDNFCSDITVHHNVIWNCSYNAFNYSRPAKNVYFYNNTAFASPDVDFSYIPDGYADTSAGNKMYNNLLSYTVDDFDSLEKKNNLTMSSLPLRDADAFDFRLHDNASGVIDRGIVIPGITDGYVGDAPDIGAYENGGVFWKAGAGTLDTIPTAVLPAGHREKSRNSYSLMHRASVVSMNISRPFKGRAGLINAQGKTIAVLFDGRFDKGVMRFDLNAKALPSGVYLFTVQDLTNAASRDICRVLKL